jgi:hypothetical protein
MEHGKKLGEGINGQPEPHHVLVAPEPGSQFIQLEVWEPQMAEGPLVQGLSVLASTSQPGGDGRLSVAEDTFCGGSIQSKGQRREHNCDLLGRRFQTIQRGMEPLAERSVTGVAPKGLDLLNATMCAIPHYGVDSSVSVAEVGTLVVGTGKALGV